jgi:heme exporter protein B
MPTKPPTLWAEVWALLDKELRTEIRQPYTLYGLLLYAGATVFTAGLASRDQLGPGAWAVLFWLILLFVAITAIAKSFLGERTGQLLYLYSLARAEAVVLAKTLYNAALLMGLGLFTALIYAAFLGLPLAAGPFVLGVLAGCLALASVLTLVSAVAAAAGNKPALMAVLSLPLLLPQLLALLRFSQGLLLDVVRWRELTVLVALAGIGWVLSLLLFPYLWRE